MSHSKLLDTKTEEAEAAEAQAIEAAQQAHGAASFQAESDADEAEHNPAAPGQGDLR